MAEFKRALASGSGSDGGFGLDPTTLGALGDLAGSYWPLIVGTILLVMLLVNGDGKAVVPVAGGMALLQAWHFGLFG